MKVIFFGTPNFAVPFLYKLINSDEIKVVAVVCQKDKPVGRKSVITPPATKTLAIKHNIPIHQFDSLKKDDVKDTLSEINADIYIVVAYGKIIPQSILDIPQFGSINVHPSLLPKYRGPSPMQEAILNGDKQTGVSIMLLDSGMDTGPILEQISIDLDSNDTYITLEKKVHAVGPSLLVKTINEYVSGKKTPVNQATSDTDVTRLINRTDGLIDWDKTAIQIDRQIRAYKPWPGAYTYINMHNKKLRLKIFAASFSKKQNKTKNGTITFNKAIEVSTGKGTLIITELQLEGKQKMNSDAFIKGHIDINGQMLIK